MPKQSPAQAETVERVMHEFKQGELRIGRTGPKVRNPKQAIAIALREAGSSNRESPKENRANLRRTKARERRGGTAEPGPTRASLYADAKAKNIPGRSRMSKEQLARALHH